MPFCSVLFLNSDRVPTSPTPLLQGELRFGSCAVTSHAILPISQNTNKKSAESSILLHCPDALGSCDLPPPRFPCRRVCLGCRNHHGTPLSDCALEYFSDVPPAFGTGGCSPLPSLFLTPHKGAGMVKWMKATCKVQLAFFLPTQTDGAFALRFVHSADGVC